MVSWGTVCACALLSIATGVSTGGDKPCAPRWVQGRSVLCVCNDTYCDEITRQAPAPGAYVAYTSSKAGSRFRKAVGEITSYKHNDDSSYTLELDASTTYQTIEGFGGGVTDAVGINWANLSPNLQDHLVNSYFGKKGLEYNMVRMPIGGSDFSTRVYAYNEEPAFDTKLTNFSLAPEDFLYKIPLTRQILDTATAPVHVVASTWSPPPWMKTNEKFKGPSALKPEYYQTYADYHAKFVREYRKYGIEMWGITTTNEPQNSDIPIMQFQSLGWEPRSLGKWIAENLGPTFKNSPDLEHIKIMTVDDQRSAIPYFFNLVICHRPEVLDYIDGVAVHYYLDEIVPPKLLELVTKEHPTKFVISTEAAGGASAMDTEKVKLGSWERAESYIDDIIIDLNYNVVGWIDWNMCLNEQGGPNWVHNYVDSAVIVFPESQEFVKQPMFYALGHFSKWIPRGSVRISSKETKGLGEESVDNVSFLTPWNTIVLILHNRNSARQVRVLLGGERTAVLDLEERSITTVEFAWSS